MSCTLSPVQDLFGVVWPLLFQPHGQVGTVPPLPAAWAASWPRALRDASRWPLVAWEEGLETQFTGCLSQKMNLFFLGLSGLHFYSLFHPFLVYFYFLISRLDFKVVHQPPTHLALRIFKTPEGPSQ